MPESECPAVHPQTTTDPVMTGHPHSHGSSAVDLAQSSDEEH